MSRRVESVAVEALVRFEVDVLRAREEGMTGRAREIALDVVTGSAGAQFDNMVTVETVLSARVRP